MHVGGYGFDRLNAPGFKIVKTFSPGRIWVNLRHERFVPPGSLNPNLPPQREHSRAAVTRHLPTSVALSVGLWSTCVTMAPLFLFK